MLLPCARAESPAVESVLDGIHLEDMQARAEGVDVRRFIGDVISGERRLDPEALGGTLLGLWRRMLRGVGDLPLRAGVPVVIGLVLRIMLGSNSMGAGAAGLLCRLAVIRVLLEACASARQAAAQMLTLAAEAMGDVVPALASALTLTGCPASAEILSPMAALCASALGGLLAGPGLSLCAAAAVIAAAGNFSSQFRLDGLFALVKGFVAWLIALLMTGFTGLLAVEGLIGAARDGAAAQSARYAVENMLPIIGGEVSGAMGALASSASLIRAAVGTTGILVVLAGCGKPALRLAASALSLKLTAAIIEPAADRRAAVAAGQLADTAEMLLALCAAGVALALLTLGAALASTTLIGRMGV